jgi:hypothetical protein
MTRATFWVAVEELAELSAQIEALTNRFAGRHMDRTCYRIMLAITAGGVFAAGVLALRQAGASRKEPALV